MSEEENPEKRQLIDALLDLWGASYAGLMALRKESGIVEPGGDFDLLEQARIRAQNVLAKAGGFR